MFPNPDENIKKLYDDQKSKGNITTATDAIVDGSIQSVKKLGDNTGALVGGISAGIGNLSNTDVGKYTIAAGAGLYAARMLAKKYQERQANNEASPMVVKKPEKKLAWMSRGPKMESVILEQNENLPRYPTIAYTSKIPKSPRSISGFFMRRRQNVYKTNAAQAGIENSRKIAAKNIKDTAAVTGVDRVIGKLVG